MDKPIALDRTRLVVVDFQTRLMPAIDAGAERVETARLVLNVAAILGAPIAATEQNPRGLGRTVEGLLPPTARLLSKMHFDATRAPGFADLVPPGRDVALMGAETHVCVLQTALGLRARGDRVFVIADAVGSRRASDREAGLARMAAAGCVVVTAEMVIFEWLESCEHPKFRDVLALLR